MRIIREIPSADTGKLPPNHPQYPFRCPNCAGPIGRDPASSSLVPVMACGRCRATFLPDEIGNLELVLPPEIVVCAIHDGAENWSRFVSDLEAVFLLAYTRYLNPQAWYFNEDLRRHIPGQDAATSICLSQGNLPVEWTSGVPYLLSRRGRGTLKDQSMYPAVHFQLHVVQASLEI